MLLAILGHHVADIYTTDETERTVGMRKANEITKDRDLPQPASQAEGQRFKARRRRGMLALVSSNDCLEASTGRDEEPREPDILRPRVNLIL